MASQYFPGVASGDFVNGVRREDIQQQPVADGSLDVVITQDVFEHVADPGEGLREVLRTLRPGGVHLFTIPWSSDRQTARRVEFDGDVPRHVQSAQYHGNPLGGGSLVVTDWGRDLIELIDSWTSVSLQRIDQAGGTWAAGTCWPTFVHRKPS